MHQPANRPHPMNQKTIKKPRMPPLTPDEIHFIRALLMGTENKPIRTLLMKKKNKFLLEHLIEKENKVLHEFARRFNTTPIQIISKNTTRYLCEIRYIYYKLRYENHGLSYSEIAREVSRAHGTVRYGVKRINELLQFNDPKATQMWKRAKDIPGFYC